MDEKRKKRKRVRAVLSFGIMILWLVCFSRQLISEV